MYGKPAAGTVSAGCFLLYVQDELRSVFISSMSSVFFVAYPASVAFQDAGAELLEVYECWPNHFSKAKNDTECSCL